MPEGAPPDHPLPSEDAFSRRALYSGTDLGRVIGLSDGVFAFAMTLLVLSLVVPVLTFPLNTSAGVEDSELAGALNSELGTIAIYVLSCFIIGAWWMTHHEVFHRLKGYDRGLLTLNIGFLVAIAITPFTLSVIAKFDLNYVTVGWFAGLQTITGVVMAVLCYYVMRDPKLLNAEVKGAPLKYYADRSLVSSAVFAASIGVGFVLPGLAPFVWVAIFPALLIVRQRHRAAARSPPASGPGVSRGEAPRPPR